MKKRLIPLAAAVLIILTGIVLYQAVYLEIQSEINAEARSNSRKMKSLAYQEKLILSKDHIEQQASALQRSKSGRKPDYSRDRRRRSQGRRFRTG